MGGFSFVSFLFVYGSRSVDFCLKSGNGCREIRNKHLTLAGVQIIVWYTALYNLIGEDLRQLADQRHQCRLIDVMGDTRKAGTALKEMERNSFSTEFWMRIIRW